MTPNACTARTLWTMIILGSGSPSAASTRWLLLCSKSLIPHWHLADLEMVWQAELTDKLQSMDPHDPPTPPCVSILENGGDTCSSALRTRAEPSSPKLQSYRWRWYTCIHQAASPHNITVLIRCKTLKEFVSCDGDHDNAWLAESMHSLSWRLHTCKP